MRIARPDRLGDVHALLQAVAGEDQHELVAAVARQRRALVGDGPAQQVADLAQDLAAGEVAVPVVDVLEVVEVEEDDAAVAAVARDPGELLRQAQVQVALVVEAGQAVALGDLVRAPRVEQVLDRDRGVVGEDLEEPPVLLAEPAGPGAVDELEDAADRGLDADRHAEHGLRLEAVGQVERRVEERIVDDVVRHVRDARRVDVADDADAGVHPLAEARLAVGAVGRDEDELVLEPVVRVLRHRVVEQDRAGLRGNEFVGLLEDLAQKPVDLDLAGVGVVRLVPFEEVLEAAVFESVDLQRDRPGFKSLPSDSLADVFAAVRLHAVTA